MYGSHSGQRLFKPKKQDDLFQTLKKEFPNIKPQVLSLIIYECRNNLSVVAKERKFVPEQELYNKLLLNECRRLCSNDEAVAAYECALLEAMLEVAQTGLSASRS
jgi:hypothetical protein